MLSMLNIGLQAGLVEASGAQQVLVSHSALCL